MTNQPPPNLRAIYGKPEDPCDHDILEPNGQLPPKYHPMRCAKCKTPLTPAEFEALHAIDPVLNKLDDDGETH